MVEGEGHRGYRHYMKVVVLAVCLERIQELSPIHGFKSVGGFYSSFVVVWDKKYKDKGRG